MGGSMSKVKVVAELNTPKEQIIENVKTNICRPLPQVQPHDIQESVIGIVCGGPSLNNTFEDLKEKHKAGMSVVSTNATHDWLMERGIRASAHVQLDARPFNARFVKNWHEKTKYLIASQSDPSVFDTLAGANTWMWHCIGVEGEKAVLDKHYLGNYFTIPGGSTVGLRAIALMRMLGFKRMEMYGLDSCYMGDEHHAYEQKENDTKQMAEVEIHGKVFKCSSWMHSQATEFCEFIKNFGNQFELIVHGDGLIAHILKTGASLSKED